MLAGNIKDAREKSGLTQKDLAEKLGISRAGLSSWELGRTKPDLDTFINLCHVLHIRSDDLLGLAFEQELESLPQPVVELAKVLAKLTPGEFSIIRRVALAIAAEKEQFTKKE